MREATGELSQGTDRSHQEFFQEAKRLMDVPSGAWLPELEMEDHHDFMNQRVPYSELMDSFSSQRSKGYMNLITRNESIQAATNNGDLIEQEFSHKATRASSFAPVCGSSSNTNFTISFGNQTDINHDAIIGKEENMSLNELIGSIEIPKRVGSTRRNHRQAQEHVLAERKRREKLTRRFILLSALLPKIKKMDKATVLEDASDYIKELQNRVKELEESSVTGENVFHKSTNSRRRSKYCNGNEDVASSFNENNSLPSSTAYYDPGIKVRISGNSVLVRIYCRRNSTLALKSLIEMKRLHFHIIGNSVLPISETSALITIIAQIGEEFVMTAMDLVKCLQSSLSSFL